jgi:hypothetical protein
MVNNVTGGGCDSDTLCPEYKVIAADVEKVGEPASRKKRKGEFAPAMG